MEESHLSLQGHDSLRQIKQISEAKPLHDEASLAAALAAVAIDEIGFIPVQQGHLLFESRAENVNVYRAGNVPRFVFAGVRTSRRTDWGYVLAFAKNSPLPGFS